MLSMAVFRSSLMCFPGMLCRYLQNDFEMVPVSLVMTGITAVFTLLLLILLLLLLLLFILLMWMNPLLSVKHS